ncbi:nitrous oxide-stimulated promoter family protein [Paenibacillus sp. FSL R7-0204]|uniref:nitrous oxide-stimulated promoter family protein n=1 Tax=Paenibacillus sp. FSL R7-0204 TaxID=2921675 RepID=UPI0030F7309F
MSRAAKQQLNDGPKIRKEKIIASKMIRIYCKRKHHAQELCEECRNLNEYVRTRLSRCKFGDEKTACAKCPIHCYTPVYRQKIKSVMRFSGPWMLLYHPLESLKHIPIPEKIKKSISR